MQASPDLVRVSMWPLFYPQKCASYFLTLLTTQPSNGLMAGGPQIVVDSLLCRDGNLSERLSLVLVNGSW